MIYELHITVKTDSIDKFKDDCKSIGVKPIVIDTQKGETQVMTSSQYNNFDYKLTLSELKSKLESLKYNILRCKVEIKPDNIKNENFIYYESHIRLKLNKFFDKTSLKEKCLKDNFHLSKNLFKKDIDFDYQMITYRNYFQTFNEFNSIIDNMKSYLTENKIEYDKIEIEECILDTNVNIDSKWINN